MQSAISSSWAVSRTFFSTSPGATRRMVRARAIFSKAVRVSSRLQSWNTKPSRSRRKREICLGLSRVTSRPSTQMLPLVGVSMVDTQLSSVDLPLPDAPIMPTNSPCSTVKLTSSMARVRLPLPPYSRTRCSTCKIGSITVSSLSFISG